MKNGEGSTMRNIIVYTVSLIVRVMKTRRFRWAGHVARMEEVMSSFKILTAKPSGKRPLERPRRSWEDNIAYPKEIGVNTRHWVDSAQDRDYWIALVNAALSHGVTRT